MLIARFRGRAPLPMNKAGEGDDGGGGESTVIDDGDGADTSGAGDRGDQVEQPIDPATLKKVVGNADPADPAEADPADTAGKKGSSHVPIGRFNEVNEEKKRLERELADLRTKPAAPPAATPEPKKEPVFDEDKAEREYATLLAEGEFDKAVAKRKEINGHMREQVRAEAEANMRSSLEQRDTVQTLTQVAQQAVKDFPYLDTEEGADVMDLIIAARDGYAAKGTPLPKALKMAVDKIAPKYAPEAAAAPGKDSTATDPAKDTRTQQANTRGADASNRQPPKLDGGAGNRTQANKVDVENLDDDQFNALSVAEKRRLRGDEG